MSETSVATPADPPAPGRGASSAAGFRPDIEGLRAVAVVLIVGYHIGLPGFGGGFVGVDVFFAISGFLITRNLLAEVSRSGAVSLGGFWARRIRRLVPGLALMLAVVLLLGTVVRPVIDWSAMAVQARAAALYVSNVYFARSSADYFAVDVEQSLFLHTWSLGVEEQFYVFWPLLIAGAVAVATRARRAIGPVLGVVLGATLVCSLIASARLTADGSPYAFYGLPTRAWQFAAAGLLALAPPSRMFRRGAVRLAARGLGLSVLLATLVLFQDSVAYPGLRAIVPVVAALLILAAGVAAEPDPAVPATTADPIGRALSAAPVRWVGRVSYSWYLWHWPFILLAVDAAGRDSLWVRSAAALASLAVGAAAFRFVEHPLRTAPWLVLPRWRTFAFGAAITVLVVGATYGISAYARHDLASAPGVSLAEVRADIRAFDCANDVIVDGGHQCQDGDPAGTRSVLLVGDSHARHWAPAFKRAARRMNLRLYIRYLPKCPNPEVALSLTDSGGGVDQRCARFQDDTAAAIRELKPDAVVLSSSTIYTTRIIVPPGTALVGAVRERIWRDGYRAVLRQVRAQGAAVGSIVDTPLMPDADPLTCIAARGADACAIDRDDAFAAGTRLARAERQARADVGDVPTLDITDVLCTKDACPVVIDGTYVYADQGHLYRGFVVTQRPAVEELLEELLAQ